MKPFRFRLDPVLRVRRFELESARLELARAEHARLRALAYQREWGRRVELAAHELAARLGTGIPADASRSAHAALRGLEDRCTEAAAGVDQAGSRADAARAQVLERHTAVRALERLRTRALREHRQQAARHEQRQLDEIAVLRAAREQSLR